jgi:hypothetical protein
MIHEEICTYEVCKLAKEKGFREKCIEHYYDDTKDLYRSSNPQCYNFGGNTSDAPTQSLLQRWLREEKGIHIEIIATASGYYWCVNKTNGTSITDSDILNRGTNEGGCFDTYELALEDALKYALENLI